MPQISRRSVDPEVQARMFNLLWDAMVSLKKRDQVSAFLKDILTKTERIMIAKRLGIALLLLEGWDQGSINRYLKVSLATIHTVKRALENGVGYKTVIQEVIRQDEWNKLKQELSRALGEILSGRVGTVSAKFRAQTDNRTERIL